ncbi:MAG: exopolyphosphatase [Rhodospirillales bacterium]
MSEPKMHGGRKYRLVTRSDLDGLVCAALLKERGAVDDVRFVHPKDMQDGAVMITNNDIIANLPYVPDCHIAFDHHFSETLRVKGDRSNHIINADAPSAARVIYDYYGGRDAFPGIPEDLMTAADKCDQGQFTEDEIRAPSGWPLLNFMLDARTGLGRFKDFRISGYQLIMQLVNDLRRLPIDEIMALPDVKERVDFYFEHTEKFKDQLGRCTTLHGHMAVIDLRKESIIYAGNRFMIYALNPSVNISLQVYWGLNRLNTVFSVGASVLNKTSKTNIGELMLEHGGGGHRNAGACQIANDRAETVLGELVKTITANG